MKCLRSGEPLRGVDEMVPTSESLATNECSASRHSCLVRQVDKKKSDTGNIEEAESSLRESGVLNYEVGFIKIPCLLCFQNQNLLIDLFLVVCSVPYGECV